MKPYHIAQALTFRWDAQGSGGGREPLERHLQVSAPWPDLSICFRRPVVSLPSRIVPPGNGIAPLPGCDRPARMIWSRCPSRECCPMLVYANHLRVQGAARNTAAVDHPGDGDCLGVADCPGRAVTW